MKLAVSVDETMREHGVPGWQSAPAMDRPAAAPAPSADRSIGRATADGDATLSPEGSASHSAPGRSSLHAESEDLRRLINDWRGRD